MRYLVNVQPVIPFSLNPDWNLITRTILPFIHMESPVPEGDDTGGIGDILHSFFFSPKDPLGGWIVGAGPVFLYPSASDDALGAEKWGAGPTAVLLKQEQGWTYGALTNQVRTTLVGKEANWSPDAAASKTPHHTLATQPTSETTVQGDFY